MSKRSKIHHYVPQHLISNFAGNARGQVCVFDKQEEKTFWTNPKNICAENGFNEFEFEEWIVSFEDAVTRFEHLYQPVLNVIVEKGSLADLADDDYDILRLFIAFQFLRTKFLRTQFDQLHELITAKFESMGESPENIEDFARPDENDAKRQYLTTLFEDTRHYAQMLIGRDIFLMSSPKEPGFILGDHPVVMHNENTYGPYGNIGWAVNGIQIFVPISPTLALACWCRSIVDEAIKSRDELASKIIGLTTKLGVSLEVAALKTGISVEAYRQQMQKLNAIISGVRKTGLLVGDLDNTDFLNSQQVRYSVRYLLAHSEVFELPKRMIKKDKKYKTAALPTIQ